MAAADEQPRQDRLARLAETPWAWLAMFAAMALLGSAVIAPKYAKREARLEQRYEARSEAARRRLSGDPLIQPADDEPAAAPDDERPLLVPIGAVQVCLVVLVVLLCALAWRATAGTRPVD